MKRTLSSAATPSLSTQRVSDMQGAPDVQPGAEQPPRPKRRVTIVESQALAPRQTIWEEHMPHEQLSAQRRSDSTAVDRPHTQRSGTIVSRSKCPVVSPAGAALQSAQNSRAADSRRLQTLALPDAVRNSVAPSSARQSSVGSAVHPLLRTLPHTNRQAPLSARGSSAGRGRRPSAENPAKLAKMGPSSARASTIAGKHVSQAEALSNTLRPPPLSARSSVFAGGGGRGPQPETLQHPASMAPLSARISAILGPVPLGARGSVFGGGRRSQFAWYEARPMRLSPRASTVLAAAAAAAAPLTPRRSRMSAVSPARLSNGLLTCIARAGMRRCGRFIADGPAQGHVCIKQGMSDWYPRGLSSNGRVLQCVPTAPACLSHTCARLLS